MGSTFGKGGGSGSSYVSGYRYFFSVLAGICRGPVDEIYLIKSDGKVFWDGSPVAPGQLGYINITDPVRAPEIDVAVGGGYPGGPITDNTETFVSQPQIYGGDKGEGGIDGMMWFYMGAKDQIIAAGDYIHDVMAPLLLSAFRGVVTVFYDGQVTANNPYPKAWNYRLRRALKGWDGPVWYPERAVIALTDPSIPTYHETADYAYTQTVYYSGNTELEGGESTGSNQVAYSQWSNGQRNVTITSRSRMPPTPCMTNSSAFASSGRAPKTWTPSFRSCSTISAPWSTPIGSAGCSAFGCCAAATTCYYSARLTTTPG
jgi:hypothetical protein